MSDINYQDECRQVVQEMLQPIMELIGGKLDELEDQVSKQREVVISMITGMHGAVTTQQRSDLMQQVQGQYGQDLGDLSEPYKDLYDKDITQELLDALQSGSGGEDQNSFIQSFLDDKRGKLGKYIPTLAKKVEATEAVPSTSEPPADEGKNTGVEMPEAVEPAPPTADLFSQLQNMRKGKK